MINRALILPNPVISGLNRIRDRLIKPKDELGKRVN